MAVSVAETEAILVSIMPLARSRERMADSSMAWPLPLAYTIQMGTALLS